MAAAQPVAPKEETWPGFSFPFGSPEPKVPKVDETTPEFSPQVSKQHLVSGFLKTS